MASADREQLGFFRTPRLSEEKGNGKGNGGDGDSKRDEIRLAQVGIFQRLYDRINEQLEYPPEFGQAGIEGTVTTHLVFSARGNFLREMSPLRSDSPYLRVLVARALRRAFSEGPIPWLASNKTPLRIPANFTFSFTVRPELTALKMPGTPTSPSFEQGLAETPPVDREPGRHGISNGAFSFERLYNTFSSLRLLVSEDSATGQQHYQPGVDLLPVLENVAGVVADWWQGRARMDPLEKYRRDPAW
jgi:hypothetical protein